MLMWSEKKKDGVLLFYHFYTQAGQCQWKANARTSKGNNRGISMPGDHMKRVNSTGSGKSASQEIRNQDKHTLMETVNHGVDFVNEVCPQNPGPLNIGIQKKGEKRSSTSNDSSSSRKVRGS